MTADAGSRQPALTCRVVVVCPGPRHEFTVTINPTDLDGDPAAQACETVYALLNIGRDGVDDLPDLGYCLQQVDAVRAWYAYHADLPPGTRLEVTTPDGTTRRLVCDATGYAHPDRRWVSPPPAGTM